MTLVVPGSEAALVWSSAWILSLSGLEEFVLEEPTGVFLTGLVSAVLGAIVAWTAYRGYTRNGSQPMLYLAIGVVFLTTVPFALSYILDRLTGVTDAEILLVITLCHLIGLLAIVRSFRRSGS